jgi:hypothetical protein
MRLSLLTLALLGQEALAETLRSTRKYSDDEVLDLLRANPWFLKRSSKTPTRLT